MFSVVILTLNEEQNLPACLASVGGCDDVVVLDSGSTDRTHALAREAGARVAVNDFKDFADQRNHAHTAIEFKHPWLFHLDADEQMTPELVRECVDCAQENSSALDGFFAAPRMIFHGRWIPHCTDYPAYQARFVHTERFRFVQAGHGQREAPGLRLSRLRGHYLHNLSSHTDDELDEKHRRYAHHEAAAFISRQLTGAPLLNRVRSLDPLVRRRAIKEMSYHLPARGMLRFVYQYGFRRGFLDGAAGYCYCRLLARYEQRIGEEIRGQRRLIKR